MRIGRAGVVDGRMRVAAEVVQGRVDGDAFRGVPGHGGQVVRRRSAWAGMRWSTAR